AGSGASRPIRKQIADRWIHDDDPSRPGYIDRECSVAVDTLDIDESAGRRWHSESIATAVRTFDMHGARPRPGEMDAERSHVKKLLMHLALRRCLRLRPLDRHP